MPWWTGAASIMEGSQQPVMFPKQLLLLKQCLLAVTAGLPVNGAVHTQRHQGQVGGSAQQSYVTGTLAGVCQQQLRQKPLPIWGGPATSNSTATCAEKSGPTSCGCAHPEAQAIAAWRGSVWHSCLPAHATCADMVCAGLACPACAAPSASASSGSQSPSAVQGCLSS